MRTPVDGLSGRIWRTLTYPARIASPGFLLARRALMGKYWVERVQERGGSGPKLKLSAGDDIQGPSAGSGPLNHRTYKVSIVDSQLDPVGLIEAFRRDPNRFSPTSYATFVPTPGPHGIVEGDIFKVKLPGPWDGPVSVQSVEPNRIRLETMVGHMEAGWIEFTSQQEGELTLFTVESFARSGDPLFDVLYHQVGVAKHFQTEMWARVLESVVQVSKGSQQGRIDVDTIIYHGAAE